jgi:hypothetical protein
MTIWASLKRHDGNPPPRPIHRRTFERTREKYEGTLYGPSGLRQCRGIDLHALGAGMRTWFRVEPGAIVFLQLKTYKLMGFAIVRHCGASPPGAV